MKAGDEFVLVERLSQVVVGPETKPLYLVGDISQARQDQNGRLDTCAAQAAQHVVARHIWEVQVEEDDAELLSVSGPEPCVAVFNCCNIERLGPEHQFD